MSHTPQLVMSRSDLDLLHEVSCSIHGTSDLDEMLLSVLSKIRSVFRIEGASIALHDPAGKELFFLKTVEEAVNRDPGHLARMRFPDHLGVGGWVLKHNRPVILQDAKKDRRFYSGLDIQENFNTRSMICLPLRTRKGIAGVLYALNRLEGKFSRKDVWLLEILSGPLAVAIDNARLYGELRERTNRVEQENRRLRTEVEDRYNLQGIIGTSPAMRRLFSLLDKVIETNTSVLLQGETGTGKELFARAIHYNGPLRDKPFVAENCGALTENLLESELFGHVRGAFTGAVADKKGLFELAEGGTVFLDEIGEMPPAMQVKLLRVLQEGEVRPVGGGRVVNVRVRLISSTNRDLEAEVEKGLFREDLFYRIHVFPMVLPPLRERREDVPQLTAYFLKKFARELRRPDARISPGALGCFCSYDWPGNVRELENEIQRALTLAENGEIRLEHLSDRIVSKGECGGGFSEFSGTLREITGLIERRMVLRALSDCGGNRSEAARRLGLTRQGLLNKIARYGIAHERNGRRG